MQKEEEEIKKGKYFLFDDVGDFKALELVDIRDVKESNF